MAFPAFVVTLLVGTDLAIWAALACCAGNFGVLSVSAINWTIVMKLVIAAMLMINSHPIVCPCPNVQAVPMLESRSTSVKAALFTFAIWIAASANSKLK